MAKEGAKKKRAKDFVTEYTVKNAFTKGDVFTKLSAIVMGLGNFKNAQIEKGILFLLGEIAYIYYMAAYGINALAKLPSLGTHLQEKVWNDSKGVFEYVPGDNSLLILLYGVVTVFVTVFFILLWRAALKSAYKAQYCKENNKHIMTFKEDVATLFDKNLHKTLLTLPMAGIVTFTVMPLVFMISMAFTNFDRDHQVPGNLFDWVGLANFGKVLNIHGEFGRTFWPILGWTVVWAVFATFLNYIFGMVVAIIINNKKVKGKAFWRFCFILSVAVPQFVSLLVVRTMLQDNGAVNTLLHEFGILASGTTLPFFKSTIWARVTVIVVNLWVGIPYTILTTTGILQNIPADLYESAKVDGANAFVTFFKITLPYMLFVTAPTLITNFIGNINNFNVIYLLTGGTPATLSYYKGTAGKTDLLVTWLYKLTIDNKDYCYGAVIGIITFVLSLVFSLVAYRRTSAYKNEEGFQ